MAAPKRTGLGRGIGADLVLGHVRGSVTAALTAVGGRRVHPNIEVLMTGVQGVRLAAVLGATTSQQHRHAEGGG